MHPPQGATALESGQIPADGLGRDREFARQPGDLDAALGTGGVEDLLVTLRCVQGDLFVAQKLRTNVVLRLYKSVCVRTSTLARQEMSD
jgi:hypothetical protein